MKMEKRKKGYKNIWNEIKIERKREKEVGEGRVVSTFVRSQSLSTSRVFLSK